MHIKLNPTVDANLLSFLRSDLGDDYAFADDKYWVLFQICLDEMMQAIQIETISL